MAQNPAPDGKSNAHDSALSVGSTDDGSAKVRELEQEVLYLAEKANAACKCPSAGAIIALLTLVLAQRFADYENEIRVLQARLRQQERKQAPDAAHMGPGAAVGSASASPTTPSVRPGISRFGSFMAGRKTSAEQQSNPNREKELEEQLIREQTARIAAEKKVREVNSEIEELSASLFQQANDMVANARAESAKLKDRIKALEAEPAKKENILLRQKLRTLEERDAERQRRLDRLESANKRIERVRALLLPR